MSGFGGGFGSQPPSGGFGGGGFGGGGFRAAPPPAPGGFGAPPSAAPGGFGSPGFGAPGGFGAPPAPGGFGAPTGGAPGFGAPRTPTAPGGFGGGFGASSLAPPAFGAAPALGGFAPTPQQQPTGFGAAPAVSGFNSTPAPTGFGGGFGSSPANNNSNSSAMFGASATSFGGNLSMAPPSSTGFGGTPIAIATPFASGAPSGGFSGSASSFGSGGAPTFGTAAPASFAQPSFPQQAPRQGPAFGSSNTFGSSTGAGFGSGNTSSFSGPVQPPSSFGGQGGNPFGGVAGAPGSAMMFGSSASVMQTNDMSMGDGGAAGGFGSGGAFGGNSGGGNSGFGSSSFAAAPQTGFGSSQQQTAFAAASPFGQRTRGDDTMGDANNTMMGSHRRSAQSPLPEASMSPPPESQTPFGGSARGDTNKKDDELARLKARLAAKKKKLEEAKLKKKTIPTPDSSPPPSPKRSSSPKPPPASGSLAERNALRFAPKVQAATSQLPTDLKITQTSAQKDYDAESETLDLQNAKSLVGLCQYMCPDDELKRRESEGDIQLLETVHHDIHPTGWNLRNTAVKRFRRSAADYKLDVPDWIRPPDVLERVCGYLEEWVMERDRQGPDPRFQGGITPAPLDVYQFIWDRTRMIRKDFILQNYVGTGGKCDARAVRCHERIARWHTMCEHQLSHIPDFARMQSQQNIAELGQAMKTLNLFYDDSLRRSTVDAPDENGRETRTKIENNAHGCESNIVMGVPPVDFDGSALRNDESTVSNRLVGVGATSPARGTAEPEMRALYILLTLENDGGMEVLKYGAKLSRERPDIFKSKPVQLALKIFKAKQQMNYSRFFSILRAPSTPYLFACLMFKHVEEMRKTAIRVMYSTYGYKRKDAPAIQDQYPLKTLGRLLCFEDMDEARTTCKHYNITVNEVEMSSSSSPTGKKRLELIFWKGSRFKIPMDEVKGIVIPLKPRKMIRTIESKLKGVTRLAVCRGEVSGNGAALTSLPVFAGVAAVTATLVAPSAEQLENMRVQKEKQQAAAVKQQQEMFAQAKQDEERRQKTEIKRKIEEKKRQAELVRKKAEEDKAKKIARKKEMELEVARKKAEAIEQHRREEEEKIKAAEESRLRAAAEAAEKKRLRAEAAVKRKADEEEARKRTEEEKRERKQQEALRKEKEERERLQKLREEAAAKKRMEEELKRQKLIAEEMERQRQEKARKAAEEAKRKAEEEERVNRARKQLLWKRLQYNLATVLQKKKTEQSLRRIDPTFCSRALPLFVSPVDQREQEEELEHDHEASDELPVAEFLEALINERKIPVSLVGDFARLVSELPGFNQGASFESSGTIGSSVSLLKLAIIVPEFEGVQAETVYDLVHKWIDSRLVYNAVQSVSSRENEIRYVVVNGNHAERCVGSDVALLVIPPFLDAIAFNQSDVSSVLSNVNERVRLFALNMDDGSDPEYAKFIRDSLAGASAESIVDISGDDIDDFDYALAHVCSRIVKALPITSTTIEVVSLSRLCADAVHSVVYHKQRQSTISPDLLLESARSTLVLLTRELESLYVNFRSSHWATWPPPEFTLNSAVDKYYGFQGDLPISWFQSLQQSQVEPAVSKISAALEGSFSNVIEALLASSDKPSSHCESLISHRQYQRCLDIALSEYCRARSFTDEDTLLYVPCGMARDLTNSIGEQMQLQDARKVSDPVFKFATDGEKEDFSSIATSPRIDTSPFSISRPADPITRDAVTEDEKYAGSKRTSTPQLIYNDEESISRSKRSHGDVDREQPMKRQREESTREKESKAFTAKLEAMMKGEMVCDMKVGDSTLSALLVGVPAIHVPESHTT